jgi:hypothetical protein
MNKSKSLTLFSLAFVLLIPLMCIRKNTPASTGKSNEETTQTNTPSENPKNDTNAPISVSNENSISELPKNWPWRGISFQSHHSDTIDINYLASIGVNFVRIEMKAPIRSRKLKTSPVQSFYDELDWVERILNACKKHGLTSIVAFNFVVLDPKSEVDDKSAEFWAKKSYQDSTLRMIDIIANKFKNRGDELSGYEVIGEPAIKAKGGAKIPPGIEAFYQNAINTIRKYDKERWFLLTPGPWGKPTNYKGFKPYNIKDKHLIYGAHMYLPDEFTHQGVRERDRNVTYPGKIKGDNWNIDLIENRLNLIKKFETEYGYPIYIGEYQAARWSPGADLWVKDVCKTLEKLNFSWSLFAYKAGTECWDPYYEVEDKSLPVEKWTIKNVGPTTPLWQYMISIYSKNLKTKKE